jgi:hypothetical protein
MSGWLIILTGAAYAYVAGEQFMRGNVWLAITYSGYAFSAIGMYMLAR